MRGVRIALAAGLALLILGIGLTLAHAPDVVTRTNAPYANTGILASAHAGRYCQSGETLPRETSALRVSLAADTGPRVEVSVRAGTRTLTSGAQPAGWTGKVVSVPVRALAHSVAPVTICASFAAHQERVIVLGTRAHAAHTTRAGGRSLAGRMTIEYLRGGSRSWASLAPSVLRRLGLERAPAGTWNGLLVIELLATMLVVSSMLVLRELR